MSTLKQQIAAVKMSSKYIWKVIEVPENTEQVLRDATTTLLAVQLVGQRKIEMLPKLLTMIKQVIKDYNITDVDCYIQSLEDLEKFLTIFENETDKKRNACAK